MRPGFTKGSQERIDRTIARMTRNAIPKRLLAALDAIIGGSVNGNIGQLVIEVGGKKVRIVTAPEEYGRVHGKIRVMELPNEMDQILEVPNEPVVPRTDA